MDNNLVFKLKSVTVADSPLTLQKLTTEAADEIERLQAEIVRLRGVVVLCPKCYEAEHGEGRWEQAVRDD